MGIAALAFASCAKDTVTEVNRGMAIDFRVATQTRAAETTTANLKEFAVTAISTTAVTGGTEGANYFTDVTYNKATGQTYYLSNPVYYWPKDGALNFYAYSPVTLPGTVSVNKAGKTVTNFTPASEVKEQVDFITATASAAYSTDEDGDNVPDVEAEGVALVFSHELAQVAVKAKNNNTGYKYTVKGFKVGNVVGKGTFDFTKAEGNGWTLSNDVASYTVEFDEKELPNNKTDETGETVETVVSLMDDTTDSGTAMLLPQQLKAWTTEKTTGTYFAVLAKVETTAGTLVYPKDASQFGWLAVAVDTKWEAGYKYVYTLDFTKGAGTPITGEGVGSGDGELFGGPIMLTANVTPWEAADEIKIEKTTPEADEEDDDKENGDDANENPEGNQ